MKKILSCLLAAVLSTSASYASSVSNKTFLMPRSAGVNKAQEFSGSHWLTDFPAKDHHSFFNVSGSYQDSTNHKELGQYFGVVANSNSFKVGARLDVNDDVVDKNTQVDGAYLIHQPAAITRVYQGDSATDAANTPVAGTVTFAPRSEAWGLNVNFQQNFTGALEHWFFRLDLPFSFATNTVGMTVAKGTSAKLHEKSYSLQDFFAGKVQVAKSDKADVLSATGAPVVPLSAERDIQNPLNRLKINGNRSENGLADLTLQLGRRFEFGEHMDRFVNIAAHVVIPTGNKIKGEYLFEPVVGNGSHVGLGARLDAGLTLWRGDDMSWLLALGTNYTYLFEAHEQRFPTLKGADRLLGHYYSAVQNVENAAFQPLVNFMPSTKVKPGSQLDSLAALAFKYCSFGFDAGYNLFWKDKETVTMGTLPEVYLADRDDLLTAAGFKPTTSVRDEQRLTSASFDLTSMANPAQLTHKIFGGVSYMTMFGEHDYPVNFHVGGSYEFAQDNAALEQYAVWLKVGASF